MKHWLRYIEKQKNEFLQVSFPLERKFDVVVVIPCYNEPDIETTLQSLRNCKDPNVAALALIIVNSGIRSPQEAVLQNQRTYEQLRCFSKRYSTSSLFFYPLLFENLSRKHAGVGLARKIGMDLAVRHFLHYQHKKGILVSLDADCEVSANYLTNIHTAFAHDEKLCCTVHNFRHRVEKEATEIEKAVRQYENYIGYFRDMLKFTGFPYYYPTIGSAFAVSADAYVRVGGMGRQQGGEDFYFLQKVFALGKVREMNDVVVLPMARFSDRVPFGTGPALQKIIDEPDGKMKVYSPDAFSVLKTFFDRRSSFFNKDRQRVERLLEDVHPALASFLSITNTANDIDDCNQNSASLASFEKRFFHHFNAFKIIKFLNFAHESFFRYEPLDASLQKSQTFLC